MNGGNTLVGHGYTVADLDRLARKAAWQSRWRFLPFDQREDIARFAIVEHLLTCAEPPDFWDLVNLGEQAIWAQVEHEGRYRGVYLARHGVEPGTRLPRYWLYWSSAARPTRSPEDSVVEVTALAQIWPRLTRLHQAVMLAFGHARRLRTRRGVAGPGIPGLRLNGLHRAAAVPAAVA